MNLSFSKQEPIEYAPRVILASQSVGRKSLLEKLGIPFRVVVTNVNEDNITSDKPEKMILKRAQAKAAEVILHPKVYMIQDVPKVLILAADSEAVVGKKTFGKATDRDNAREIIKELMNKSHTFITGVVAVYLENGVEKKRWEKTTETKVTLGKMTGPELEQYVARYDFTRFAGGYALNEAPWDLVTKIDGSYTNVIGLPFEVILPIFRSLKIIVDKVTP